MQTQTKIEYGSATLLYTEIADVVELYKMLAPLHDELRRRRLKPRHTLMLREDASVPERVSISITPTIMAQLKNYAHANGVGLYVACSNIIREWLKNNGTEGVVISNREPQEGSRSEPLVLYVRNEDRELVEKHHNGLRYSVFLRSVIEAFFDNNQSVIINTQTKEQHE